MLLLLFFLILFLCIPCPADIVRLKDGRSHEGEIVEENDAGVRLKVEMERGTAYVTIPADQIRRVIRESPEERERRIEERNLAKGLVKDGDEWVTQEVKAARDAQRAPLQTEIDKLKQEQRQLKEKEDAFRESLDESRQRMSADLRSVVLRLVFCVVIAAIAFTLLKRYFWD